jgi:hypothetical protein
VTGLGLGRGTVLFDADPLGGGLDRLVAAATVATCAPSQDPAPISAPFPNTGFSRPRRRDAWPHDSGPPRRLRPGRRTPSGELSLVSWALRNGENIPVTGMRNALRELRCETGLVVVDLPRAIDDSAQLALSEATHALVIAPVSERAAVATSRLLPQLSAVGPRPELVLRLPGRDDLTPREFADLLGLPLAGVVRPHRGRIAVCAGLFSRFAGRSALSLDRFSRRFIERCATARPGCIGAAGVAA